MSALTVNKPLELPVWVVHGFNWTAEVKMDEYNSQFTPEIQAYEAATKAFAAILGRNNDVVIKMDDGQEKPSVGTTMIVHLVGTDPLKGHAVFSHVVFANEGKYKESITMEKEFQKEIEQIAKTVAEEEQAKEKGRKESKKIKKPKKIVTKVSKKGLTDEQK